MSDTATSGDVPSAAASGASRSRFDGGFIGGTAITVICALVTAAATGQTLGTFFSAFFIVALVLPPLSAMLSADCLGDALKVCAGVVGGIVATWLPTLGSISLTQLLVVALLLASWSATLLRLVRILRRAHITPIASSAITTVIALLWLTCPVWLSPHLTSAFGE